MIIDTKHSPAETWRLEPLKGKYYGTIVSIGEGQIAVWGTGSESDKVSHREIEERGWTPEDDYTPHVERETDLANAQLIVMAAHLFDFVRSIALNFGHDPSSDGSCLPWCRVCKANELIAKVKGGAK